MSRSWLPKFRLRTLICACILIAISVGLYASRIRSQQQTIAWVEQNGGYCLYDFVYDGKNSFGMPMPPRWIVNLIGCDALANVNSVNLDECEIDSLTNLSRFKHLEHLYLNNSNVIDLKPLAEMHSLIEISLEGTSISDISPLCQLPNLIYLNVRCESLRDISQLVELHQLERLSIPHGIERQEIELLKQRLLNCKISSIDEDGYWVDH